MRIPPKYHPEILTRHAAGQSDQAIATWLAHLAPPITVSRVAVLQTRQRLGGGTKPTAKPPASGKASGAQGVKARAARTAQEAKDHNQRGAVLIGVALGTDPTRAHLAELQVLLDLQQKVNSDPLMTLPEKIRHTTSLAQAMSKVRIEAELQKRIAELEQERAAEVQALSDDRRQVDLDRKRLEEERRELDEEWTRLRAERQILCATPPEQAP